MVVGAFNPEEQYSLQHVMDMLGTALLIYGAYKAVVGGGLADDALGVVDDVWDDAARAGDFVDDIVKATVDTRKFSEYIFKDGATHGKDVVYRNLGYSAKDSFTLSQIYHEQAAAKYATGNYTLGKLTEYGQLINIEIELPGIGNAAASTSYLKSGWMINPDNSIRLVTPFAGFTR